MDRPIFTVRLFVFVVDTVGLLEHKETKSLPDLHRGKKCQKTRKILKIRLVFWNVHTV